jgi:phosphoglycolate phosphatase
MTSRFQLLVFDWDGTLVDSAQAIVDSLQGACVDLGYEPPSDERARHIIGLGLKDALRYAIPHVAESEHRRIVERYRVHFLARDAHMALFPGVMAGLERLQQAGSLLAIATGKSRRGLERALDQVDVRRFFVASRCADEGYSKPHPGMLQAVMAELAVRPEDTLMIGDTTHDLDMAANAGVRSLAVSYGAHPKDQLVAAGPEACIDTPSELFDWLSVHG